MRILRRLGLVVAMVGFTRFAPGLVDPCLRCHAWNGLDPYLMFPFETWRCGPWIDLDLRRLVSRVHIYHARHDRWPDSLDAALAPDAPGEFYPGGVPVWVPIGDQGGALVWLGPGDRLGRTCTCNIPTDGVLWVLDHDVYERISRRWTPDPAVPLAEGTQRDAVNRALPIAGAHP
jgi:hypothetical protein